MKKVFKVAMLLIILSPIAGFAILYPQLPDMIALHFDASGTPDRVGSKSEMWLPVLLVSGMALLIFFFLPQVHKIDPKKNAVQNVSKLRSMAVAIALVMTFICWIIVDTAGRGTLNIRMQFIIFGLGLLWCFMGNYMYNIKPNYFAGFRLPWTLNNEENWRITHWLAAKLFVAAGLLICLMSLLLEIAPLIIAFVVINFITITITSIYSYRLHKKMSNGAFTNKVE